MPSQESACQTFWPIKWSHPGGTEPGKLREESWVTEEEAAQRAVFGMGDTEISPSVREQEALQGNLRGSRVVPDIGTADSQLPQ